MQTCHVHTEIQIDIRSRICILQYDTCHTELSTNWVSKYCTTKQIEADRFLEVQWLKQHARVFI